MDLSRFGYERIDNYNNDNIRRYHEKHNADGIGAIGLLKDITGN